MVTIEFDAIRKSPRALLYLTVACSTPGRSARRSFSDAVERLSADHAALGIAFYSLDEEDASCRDFLASLGFSASYPRGSGSSIRLEAGREVASVVAGHRLGPECIVEQTLALWDA
jgi:hypothetical protein